MTIGRNRRDFHELDKNNLSLGGSTTMPRARPPRWTSIDTHRSFRDAHLTLTEDQVKIETARCLGCGASVVGRTSASAAASRCTTKCESLTLSICTATCECNKMVKSGGQVQGHSALHGEANQDSFLPKR